MRSTLQFKFLAVARLRGINTNVSIEERSIISRGANRAQLREASRFGIVLVAHSHLLTDCAPQSFIFNV